MIIKVKSKKAKGKIRKMLCRFSDLAPIFFLCLFTFYFLLSPVSAQDDDDPAPPPLKLMTKEERIKLDGAPDLKERTKMVVELMRSNLDAAEKFNKANDFDGIFREFGHFRALLDYAMAYLQKQDLHENRSLDNYKRLELSLRAAMPRIETIRRELPLRYEEYVREFLNYVREARAKTLDPMFSDTVLPNGAKK